MSLCFLYFTEFTQVKDVVLVATQCCCWIHRWSLLALCRYSFQSFWLLMLLHPPQSTIASAIIIEKALQYSLDIESEIVCLADSLEKAALHTVVTAL